MISYKDNIFVVPYTIMIVFETKFKHTSGILKRHSNQFHKLA